MFSVVIPTLGRGTLARTLASIRDQAAECDVEILLVADTHGGLARPVDWQANWYGVRYFELDAGRHDTGSPQLELGYREAQGDWILNLGDDDVYEPLAFAAMTRAIRQETAMRPMLFRTVLHPAPHRGNEWPVVVWNIREIIRGRVSGQCFAVPNVPERLGRWVDDVTFMTETVAAWGGDVAWRTEIISQCY